MSKATDGHAAVKGTNAPRAGGDYGHEPVKGRNAAIADPGRGHEGVKAPRSPRVDGAEPPLPEGKQLTPGAVKGQYPTPPKRVPADKNPAPLPMPNDFTYDQPGAQGTSVKKSFNPKVRI